MSSSRPERRKAPGNWPPTFWDKVPKLYITPRSLREFDRRTAQTAPAVTPISRGVEKQHILPLKRYARQGGPCLDDLTSYTMKRKLANAATRASQRKASGSSGPTTPSRQISAYDKHFERYVEDHGVVFNPKTTPAIVDHLQSIVRTRRASLTPDTFPDSRCSQILNTMSSLPSQCELFSDAFPHLTGNHLPIPHAQNRRLNNLAAMMGDEDEVIAIPQPDYFDGHAPSPENHRLRKELHDYVVPLERSNVPMLPNLFLEIKGGAGDLNVARLQAVQDGLFGARGMKQVRCLALRDDATDNEKMGCAVVITYSALVLSAYVVYTMPSTSAEREEDYHVKTFASWLLHLSTDTVRDVTQALRNLRDWAAQQREIVIREANERMGLRSSPSVKAEGLRRTPKRKVAITKVEEGGTAGPATSKRPRRGR